MQEHSMLPVLKLLGRGQMVCGCLSSCCVCRRKETWSVIKSAGFSSCDITHFEALSNPLFALLSPHIVGRAVK